MSDLIIGTLRKTNDSLNIIYLCPELASNFKKGDKISVFYGQAHVRATVFPINQSKVVALSGNLWRKLSIPFAHKLHICRQNNSIHLGPLMGIMSAGIFPGANQLVGKRTGLIYRYLRAQEEIPLSYFVFGPADISFASKQINGYFLIKKNGKEYWRKYKVPFPDVVYNRLPNRTVEKIPSVKRAKQGLEASGVKLFNPNFFNKWTLHKQIHQVKKIGAYMPETILRPTVDQLKELLHRYKMVYLKPAGGSLGLGIFQLYQTKQGIVARFRGNKHNQLKRFPNLSAALSYLFSSRSITRYIAQQGIRLIKINNRSVDFRIHTNKDRYGNWQMTAAAAKMAGKGSVTTHMRTGGKVLSYDEVLKVCFPHNFEEVKAKVKEAVLALSEVIDERVPGHIGELGFDIGIDTTGHPWMFEANSKPGRHVFSHRSMKKDERVTRVMVLDYALFLANFTSLTHTHSQSVIKGGQP